MSLLQQVEQTTSAAAPASNQYIYPKAGSYARMDATGMEKILLDSSTYAAAMATITLYLNYGGV